jgi:hypothetical protein
MKTTAGRGVAPIKRFGRADRKSDVPRTIDRSIIPTTRAMRFFGLLGNTLAFGALDRRQTVT